MTDLTPKEKLTATARALFTFLACAVALLPIIALARFPHMAFLYSYRGQESLVKPADAVMNNNAGETSPPNRPTAIEVSSSDRLTHPPIRQVFENGPYQLVIMAADEWRSPLATAQLFKADTRLWQQDLAQQYGPRFSLVSPQGHVILFDEYINVASPYAIALIDPTGKTIAQYSFDDLQAALPNVTRADLTRQATSGWWISSPPILDESTKQAVVETGGTTLAIDLATGILTTPPQ